MVLYDVVFAALSDDDLASRTRVMHALQSQGAVSPAGARPIGELNVATDDTWQRLVVEGRIREGPPGYFYLFERNRASPRQRIAKLVVFYLVLLLIPIILIFLSGHDR